MCTRLAQSVFVAVFGPVFVPVLVADTGHPSLADVHPRAEHAVQPHGGVGIAIAPPAPP
jgi:hypothetical protein